MKKLFGIIAVTAIVAAAGWNFSQSQNEVEMSDLALANVEALAQSGESSSDERGKSPETKRCMKKFPDGSFTSSVERICTPSCSSCTCKAVSCGEAFYN